MWENIQNIRQSHKLGLENHEKQESGTNRRTNPCRSENLKTQSCHFYYWWQWWHSITHLEYIQSATNL